MDFMSNFKIYIVMNEIDYDFSKLHAKNAQHVQWVTDSLAVITDEVAEAQGFGTPWTNFKAKAEVEISYFKPDRTLLDTEDIVTVDSERDSVVSLRRALVKSFYELSLDADIKNAARIVKHAFDEAGDVTRLDYASETSTLTDLIARLRTEPYLSALETLNMSGIPDELEAANKKFNDLYLKRSKEERVRSSADMKLLRKDTDAAFDAMAKAINAFYLVNELTTQDASKRETLQEIIDKLNDILYRFRKTISGSAAGTGTETPEEPTTGSDDTDEPTDPSTGDDTQEPENPDGGDGGDEENPSGPGIPNP